MPSPVTPGDLKELIPAPGGSFCEKVFKNLLRGLPEMVYAIVAWERDENGDLSDDFKAELCALDCFCGGGSGSDPGGGLGKPVISATDGTFSSKVQITWATVTSATKYYLYRSLVNTFPTANTTPLAIIDAPTLLYDDTSVVIGTIYYYWVRAVSGSDISPLSNSDSGYAEDVSGQEIRFVTPGINTWTVPAGVVSIDIRTVGGGGSGGGGRLIGRNSGGAGGGGGGGGYTEALNVITTPGEVLSIEVGAGGVHPGSGNPAWLDALNHAGNDGGLSAARRGATVLATSAGGKGGLAPVATVGAEGAGGAGGAGTASVGVAGQPGLDVVSAQFGGVGGASGQPLYSKGIGGTGQTIVGTVPLGAEDGGGGGLPISAQPGNGPSSGGSGIVVIFY